MLIVTELSSNMVDRNGNEYPERGLVTASEWSCDNNFNNGLWGYMNGAGDGYMYNNLPDNKYALVEADLVESIEIKDYLKFKTGVVKEISSSIGDIYGKIANYLGHRSGLPYDIVGKHNSEIVVGNSGMAVSNRSSISGIEGVSVTSNRGSSIAGNNGTALTGSLGVSIAGENGLAIAGYLGKASAGDGGMIIITYFDAKADRMRAAIGYVNENIEPNVLYSVKDGKFIK